MNEITPSARDAAAQVRADSRAEIDAVTSPLLETMFLRPQRVGVESAWYGHVPFAHWIAAACRPAVLVELGTHYGVSYFAFCEALARQGADVRAYAVDTWRGDPHAGTYGDEVFESVDGFNNERYRGFSTLLRGTFADAVAHFADGTVDLLHIDGFHTYDAVRADWEAWRPKLSDQAVVLFHDTNVRERDFGVWRLWAELRQTHPTFEFLHSHGLGVLAFGRHAPSAVRDLCGLADPAAIVAFRERFALLGERWIEAAERRGNIAAQQRAEAAFAGKQIELEYASAEIVRLEALQRTAAAERHAERADELQRYLDATREELTRVHAEADVLRRQEAADRSALEGLRSALRQAHEQAATLAATVSERDRLATDLTLTETALLAEQAYLRHLTGSAAWRVAAPLRRLESSFPNLTRQAGRAVRLGSSVATGRLPGRLRLRRRVRADADILRGSPLFDESFYRARYPEVAQSGADPLWHYIWTGAHNGYDPHPLFSSRFYLEQHPELAQAHANPLAHYLQRGAAAGDDPHPLFDTAFYVTQEPEAAGQNAVLHYLEWGAARSRDPNPLFDTDGYWESYIRGAETPLEPLTHYVLQGAEAGYDPHPLFDTDWYARRYPDCAGCNPLAHYLQVGRAQGHAPCLFWSQGAADPPALHFAASPEPDVSIIVPAYGRLFDTLRCLYAVMAHSGDQVRYEVIVVDDNPAAPIAPRLRAIPGLRVEQNASNLGFLRSCNRAAAAADGRYLLFLNNDTSVHPGWLAPLVELADRQPRVAIVGAMLLNADGTVQEAGGTIHSDGWGAPFGRGQDPSRPEFNFVREVDVVIGACLLVRTAAWHEMGGFDDQYAPAYYEEFDLAFALRDRGWRVMYQPASRVTHFDASSYGAEERDRQSVRNHARFCRKWAAQLKAQPGREIAPYIARARPPAGGRILFVDDRVPEPDKHAGSTSTLHWLRLLRDAGLHVTFAPHDQDHPEPYTAALQAMGVEVLFGPTDLPGWLAENGAYLDYVWATRPDVTEPLMDAIGRYAPGRLIYNTCDLHSLREQRRYELAGDPAALGEARRLRRVEREIFRGSRLVISPSRDEVPVIEAMLPGVKARAIPLYSVPAAPIHPMDASAFTGRDSLVFVGGYAHTPNVDAALWLAGEIMPLVWRSAPAARLILVGSKAPDEVRALAGPQIEVAGWVAEVGPIYAKCRASISPLRYGAGVKGKVIDALAAGVPVITTPIGNEGIGLIAGKQALIGATAEQLADHAIAVLRDDDLCARLAENGAAVLRGQFDEDAARRVLGEVLGIDICPCCGRRAAAPVPVLGCESCGADATGRAMAEAAIRPWRARGLTCLADAAPILALSRAYAEDAPLATALGTAAGQAAAPLDLLMSRTPGALSELVGPGGRWIFPATPGAARSDAAALGSQGWIVRLHEAGPDVVEAERPRPTL